MVALTTTWHKRGARPESDGKPEGWTSDKWATPWPLVHDLEAEFGVFELDPCAEPHTAKAPKFYTVEQDGLGKPWFGRVFVNPPFSKPRPWLERAYDATSTGEAELVICLLPASVDTRWFHEAVLPFAELRFIRGRVRYLGWEGTPIPAPRLRRCLPSIEASSRVSQPKESSAAYHQGFLAAADKLEEPYPADVFTPMSADEVSAAVKAMNEAVPHASERMHAGWARHWADVLRLYAREIEPSV